MTTTLSELRQPPQGDVAMMKPKDKIAQLLDRKKGEIAKMLPKHLNAERLLKVAQIAATTTPALLECEIPSLVGAIGQCAQMGLEPNTVLGHAYLVPFNVKRKDVSGREFWAKSVQVVIGYKGLIDLARRSGQIVSIAAHEVCENDKFDLVYGLDERLTHVPSLGDRGKLIGFYAVAKLKDGGHCFEFMSLHQVQEIMASTQSKGKYGPWKDNFVEMGRKTVIRRLSKYLPLSIEFQAAAALDGMAEAGKDQKLETIDGEFAFLPDDAPAIHVDAETGEIQGQLSNNASVTLPQSTGRRDPAEFDAQAKAEQVRADYGDAEAQHFEPDQPKATNRAQKPAPVQQSTPAARQNAAAAKQQSAKPAFDLDAFADRLAACTDVDTLDVIADEASGLQRDQVINDDQFQTLMDVYRSRKADLNGGQLVPPAQQQAQTTTRRRTSSAAGQAPE
jgi:recombination protein RecT